MKTSYFHLRNSNGMGTLFSRGGITYAFQETEDGVIVYGVAYCSPKDNYNKKYGRAKAQGRMNSPTQRKFFNGGKEDFVEAIWDGVV